MGFADKWPSRLQGQWFFLEVGRAGKQQFSVGLGKFGFFGWAATPTRIYLSQIVRGGGEVNILHHLILRGKEKRKKTTQIGHHIVKKLVPKFGSCT